jgi:hypothetical protein
MEAEMKVLILGTSYATQGAGFQARYGVVDMVMRPTQLEARRFKEGQWHERVS